MSKIVTSAFLSSAFFFFDFGLLSCFFLSLSSPDEEDGSFVFFFSFLGEDFLSGDLVDFLGDSSSSLDSEREFSLAFAGVSDFFFGASSSLDSSSPDDDSSFFFG